MGPSSAGGAGSLRYCMAAVYIVHSFEHDTVAIGTLFEAAMTVERSVHRQVSEEPCEESSNFSRPHRRSREETACCKQRELSQV